MTSARTATTPSLEEISLTGTRASVADARAFVRGVLAGCPRTDDLVQAAGELAANAVTWSSSGEGGRFTVRVRTAPRWARVEVTDSGPAARPRDLGNGWGLAIVAAVSDRAGATIALDGARTAWAEATWRATEIETKTKIKTKTESTKRAE